MPIAAAVAAATKIDSNELTKKKKKRENGKGRAARRERESQELRSDENE